MSNRAWFRYCWVWNKKITGNPFLAKFQPLKIHEDICVFSKKAANYYPQMRTGQMRSKGGGYSKLFDVVHATSKSLLYNPDSILEFSNSVRGGHPTQKPIALLEYLVKTYTNEGDMILDNTCGSGTALVAARNTNRRAVGIEMDEGYCRIAAGRLGRFEPSEFEVDKKAVEGQLGLFGAIA